MHTFFKIAVLLLLNVSIYKSQIFLRAYNYRPTGDFGYVFKPGYSAEIGYMPEFENNRVRVCFSGTYMVMKPRMEEFPIYGVLSGNGTTTLLPGTQSFKKYNLLHLFAGIDVAVVKRKKFFAYLGTDITIGAGSVDQKYEIKTFTKQGYSGGGYIGGFRFRLGIQYDITDHIGIIAHANRIGYIISEPKTINWFNDYGIGIRYQFN